MTDKSSPFRIVFRILCYPSLHSNLTHPLKWPVTYSPSLLYSGAIPTFFILKRSKFSVVQMYSLVTLIIGTFIFYKTFWYICRYYLLWLIIIIISYRLLYNIMSIFPIILQFYIRICIWVSTVNCFQEFCNKNEVCLLVYVLIVSISKLFSVVHVIVVI